MRITLLYLMDAHLHRALLYGVKKRLIKLRLARVSQDPSPKVHYCMIDLTQTVLVDEYLGISL